MNNYLFSDADVWHREIRANTFKGALLKAKRLFGIAVPLRLVREYGPSNDYRAPSTGYECSLRLVD